MQHRIVLAEDLRQHPFGVFARQFEPVCHPLTRKFLHLVESDGHTQLRLDQEVRLSQEPREQHAVPVLVSAFLNEAPGLLRACLRVPSVSKLSAMRAQSGSKGALVCGQISRRVAVANTKLLGGLAGARLSDATSLFDRFLELSSEVTRQYAHSFGLMQSGR